MKKKGLIFLLLAAPVLAWGQTTVTPDRQRSPHGDCADPIELIPGMEYVHAESPSGPGRVQEFNGNQGASHFFPAEINTVWYSFRAPADGLIVFEITPFRIQDDYDWMLFKQEDPASCDSIFEYGIKPIRSNRARNDLRIDSKTGLHTGYANLHAPPGPGKSYSKPLPVRKGQSYLLVLDNIYPGGEGHRILIRYADRKLPPTILVKGKIIDHETGEPLAARIFAEEDSTARTLLKKEADSVSSDFSFPVPAGTPVHLAALKKGYLLATEKFTVGTKDTAVVLKLEPAHKGSRMILFNIRFLPNKAEFQPSAFPELERLLEFMLQSGERYIRITGHTNSNVFANKNWLLDLSVYRAAAVRDYLTAHGVPENRIRIAGAGGSRPLIQSNDMKEAMKNLRVEIELLN